MITRLFLKRGGNLQICDGEMPAATVDLEREGFAHVPGALTAAEVEALAAEMSHLFDTTPPDVRLEGSTAEDYADFRYEALNHSALAQISVAHL